MAPASGAIAARRRRQLQRNVSNLEEIYLPADTRITRLRARVSEMWPDGRAGRAAV